MLQSQDAGVFQVMILCKSVEKTPGLRSAVEMVNAAGKEIGSNAVKKCDKRAWSTYPCRRVSIGDWV